MRTCSGHIDFCQPHTEAYIPLSAFSTDSHIPVVPWNTSSIKTIYFLREGRHAAAWLREWCGAERIGWVSQTETVADPKRGIGGCEIRDGERLLWGAGGGLEGGVFRGFLNGGEGGELNPKILTFILGTLYEQRFAFVAKFAKNYTSRAFSAPRSRKFSHVRFSAFFGRSLHSNLRNTVAITPFLFSFSFFLSTLNLSTWKKNFLIDFPFSNAYFRLPLPILPTHPIPYSSTSFSIFIFFIFFFIFVHDGCFCKWLCDASEAIHIRINRCRLEFVFYINLQQLVMCTYAFAVF